MNRSARVLLGVAALAPLAALAVAAAPANAAPGPSTAFLYDTAAAAYPVTRTLPDPVVRTGGQTAETVTGAVDGVLRAAPGTSRVRPGADRCKLNPGRTVNSKTGAGLPETPLPAVGRTPLGGLAKGDCLGARRADMPVSMALPADLPAVPPVLGSAQPGGLPVGSGLFPAGARHATPVPSDDVLGKANGTVNKAGANLDQPEQGVGRVVDVLKAKERAARPASGPGSDGPLSMPDAAALGLPALPALPGIG
ncbi:hypothetical protein [Actinomadura latina]|uniref:Uncharacterized protein n=1 Tax=Actinomadura latina TaxID=163603 RepID=A0A846Z6Y4_9ACTN|nr:hypothetical protein [Actinomadura latina]NKZ08081.1 hypothetical protein [Actinomadura latina]